MKKIVALVDGSVYAKSVCDHVAWIAGKQSFSIDLLHVIDERSMATNGGNLSGNIGLGARTSLMEELAELDAKRSKLAQQKGRAILDDAADILRHENVSGFESKLRLGDLVETVTIFEQDADLIVIGKRGEAADFAKMHLGSNLERVVRASRKPILTVSREFKDIQNVLIAYDGGASSELAIDTICKEQLFKGLDFKLLTVASSESTETQIKLDQAAGKLQKAGLSVKTQIETGNPAKVITEQCKSGEADLLIMGAYGHSKIRNLIIGSTTTEMLRHCLVPVMLFR